jgi:hypothetical protein
MRSSNSPTHTKDTWEEGVESEVKAMAVPTCGGGVFASAGDERRAESDEDGVKAAKESTRVGTVQIERWKGPTQRARHMPSWPACQPRAEGAGPMCRRRSQFTCHVRR